MSECALTVHASCQHLVPDFCGMPMSKANEILMQLTKIRSQPPLDHKRGQMAQQTMRANPLPQLPRPPQQEPLNLQPVQDIGRPATDPRLSNNSYMDYDQHQPLSTYGLDARQRAQQDVSVGPGPASPTRPYAPRGDSMNPQMNAGRGAASVSATAAAAAAAAYGNYSGNQQNNQNDYNSRTSPGQNQGYGSNEQAVKRTSEGPSMPTYDPSRYKDYTQPSQQQYARPNVATQYSNTAPTPKAQEVVPQQAPIRHSQEPKLPQQAQLSQRRIGLEHFNFLAVLGKGNFGKVMLAETKATKKLYAIKVLKKEFIIENDEVESTKSEKRVFLVANKERHPFLLNLHACFQTETRVYFVMEYISGGDLMWHIQRGQFGLKRAQFYAAEVCLALKYFHENGVIYRDLKLDNILLTLDGHIKIADYGLCKEEMWFGSTTSTFCGTPEFMAPEVSSNSTVIC